MLLSQSDAIRFPFLQALVTLNSTSMMAISKVREEKALGPLCNDLLIPSLIDQHVEQHGCLDSESHLYPGS